MRPDRITPLMVALYQPDIPQNTGTILRMCACLGLKAAIIEPAGFLARDKHFRRAGMDYLAHVEITRFLQWEAFEDWRYGAGRRLVLLTTKASLAYTAFCYLPGDILLRPRVGRRAPPRSRSC
jgi:tRNA (cytidine/uridine-2'-O-)-methyltransferase